MATFLLELLTEEIPANGLAAARRQLAEAIDKGLGGAGLAGSGVRALSTSRRLVVIAEGLPKRQPDRTERVTGPPASVAYGKDGAPTKAAEGFARKVGLPLDRLEIDSTPKGDYLAATVLLAGRPTSQILAELVPSVVAGLRFPKMMRWGRGEQEFVRPLHRVVALLDAEVVPFDLLGVASGRTTEGHRVHAPAAFELAAAGDYLEEMSRRLVVVDPDERRQTFAAAAALLTAGIGCRVHPDDELMAEHVELVEHPGLLLGSFDEAFLELPREVVITTLRHHQKCLVMERADGSLAPHFLAVIDRRDDPEGLVRQGNEWVIGARLADARFFFDEDRRRPLDELVPGLERLEFHRRLGSVADKAARVGELAAAMAAWVGSPLPAVDLTRAARLVKADLLTGMVVEFTELQGVMGGHYLRLAGEPEALWTAARDHYIPQGFESSIPASEVGRLIGAADRLDTLAGLFGVGEVPSGSRDPHGLRRAAQALVKIVAEAGWELDLSAAIRRAVELFTGRIDGDPGNVTAAVSEFVAERVRRYLIDVVGVAFDTADAVMAAGWARLPELVARARALEAARSAEAFRWLALGFKRVRNITDGQPEGTVDPALFQQPEEGELHRHGEAFRARLDECLEARRFDDAFAAMATLADVLERFFVEVLVMTDDEAARTNRIALLKELGAQFMRLADLSKLQIEGGS
ncbi:MAG TPA: glycine--tRNA ligase subunit beta [Thermoanaerobaculales bacterium]|nr:glycine--tRNA ligase subunit beta [Thermoanaerobaculales bacterium]